MKPILFNTEMVRAILEGRKTVTRRVAKTMRKNSGTSEFYTPIMVGDVLYVRETWGCYSDNWFDAAYFVYKADYPDGATTYTYDDGIHICDLPKWKPSIHMPKDAARIFLKVTSVRVERLQDMKLTDFFAEGVKNMCDSCNMFPFDKCDTCDREAFTKMSFMALWDSTIKPDQLKYYGWEANPYVWVIEFERVDKCSD